ncbi:AbrB/MazE/SpoVT family DNA-binding domain-containing protein [Microvirga brassicacearum]|uniref:AbrB/MazE/SpoVT family DNA-binding domain-containing protein n=1 Tax=Microvirga brassicacearum TaxID=2580413 RepID=A0A5N3PB76_9HYPH|nr:AbrB/MazE/SpoVT family DNA-binding domain-containing protein [Microvirga brassicacearum]KAB0266997.1 AbrB/MazE/SpoVT family DNA-binding domain-containing protein [Microvirga brassicacearum]
MPGLKVRKIGNSVGVVLPRDVALKLRVMPGDQLFVSETPNGIELSPYDPEFEADMELAREIMQKRRAVLRELAK